MYIGNDCSKMLTGIFYNQKLKYNFSEQQS